MSRWVDRVRNHSIWSTIGGAGASVNQALEREGLNADMIDSLERLRTVLSFGGMRLSSTDPVLIPPVALDNAIQTINQLRAHVDTFISNSDIGQLNAANTQADIFLVNLNLVYGTSKSDDLAIISEAASSYRATLEKHLNKAIAAQDRIFQRVAEIEGKAKSLETILNTEQQRLNTLINDQQTQFSTAQDKRASDFSAVLSEQKALFSSEQSSIRSEFSDLELEIKKDHGGLINGLTVLYSDADDRLSKSYSEHEKEYNDNVQLLKNKYQDEAAAILQEVKDHKTSVESLVGVIGNLGVTSGYLKAAQEAKKARIRWQRLTVTALGGLVVVALLLVFSPNGKVVSSSDAPSHYVDTKVEGKAESKEVKKDAAEVEVKPFATPLPEVYFYRDFFSRLFLSITFGVLAAYAGKQASRFLEIEQSNERRALELEAFGPFIEPLDKETRDKFRLQIGERSFAVPNQEPAKQNEDDPVTAISLLKPKEVIDAVSNLVKSIKQ